MNLSGEHNHEKHDRGHNHSHDGEHIHDPRASSRNRVAAVFIFTSLYMVVEAIGGWLTGSLALLGDAGHMLTDAGALGLALLAFKLADSPPSPQRSFGLHRAEILAALFNGIALLGLAALVIVEAYHRLISPRAVQGKGMLIIAIIGLIVNLLGAYILIGGDKSNLNLRGALFHVAGDAIGSVGAIAAASVIILTGWTKIDPAVSFVIAAIIIVGAIKLVNDAAHIVLESTPRNIDLLEVEKSLVSHRYVKSIHDLHIWTITSGFVSLSAHVVVDCEGENSHSIADTDLLISDLGNILKDRFEITHYTLQIEKSACNSRCCYISADEAAH